MVRSNDEWEARENELLAFVNQLEHDKALAAEENEDLRHLVETLEGKIEEKERDIRTLERHVDYWQGMGDI